MIELTDAALKKLNTCTPVLQAFIHYLAGMSPMAFTVTDGFRGKEEQNKAFKEGKSQLQWPDSAHNKQSKIISGPLIGHLKPDSQAVDLAPVTFHEGHMIIEWTNEIQWYHLAGIVRAASLIYFNIITFNKYKIRWGGDWNDDGILNDQSFYDLEHFELIELKED